MDALGKIETPLRKTRRSQLARIKKLRCKYWAGRASLTKRLLGMVSQTPAICSCWACKNRKDPPRRSILIEDINEFL